HFLRGGDDLAGVNVLLGPRHFGDVDEAFDAGLELDEGAVVGDVGDAALVASADRILGLDALPRIVEQLLHAKRDAVRLVVDLDDLDLHLLADVEHFGRVIDAAPGDIGDVQEAVDAAEVDERTVVGDVLDHAVDDLTLFEVLHQFLALLGAGLFQHGAARDDDVAAAAIHLEDLELLRRVHQRRDVADRADVDLRTRQEGHGAVEIDREAALDLVEDRAGNLLVVVEGLLQLAPAFLAARLVARQHGLTERILDALQVDLDDVADLDLGLAARRGELAQRDTAFGLGADVDDGEVLLDADDRALHDSPFLRAALGEGLFEHRGEIFARRAGCSSGGHELSCERAPAGWNDVRKRGLPIPQDRKRPPESRRAGAKTVLMNEGSIQAALRRGASGALSSNNEGRSVAPSARSGGLDDVDGGPDGGGYIHFGGIEQVRIRRLFQGGGGPIHVACVARPDVGEHGGLVHPLAGSGEFERPAARAHLGRGGDEYLHLGLRTDDGADVAAVEHRARRLGGKVPLESQQRRPHLWH